MCTSPEVSVPEDTCCAICYHTTQPLPERAHKVGTPAPRGFVQADLSFVLEVRAGARLRVPSRCDPEHRAACYSHARIPRQTSYLFGMGSGSQVSFLKSFVDDRFQGESVSILTSTARGRSDDMGREGVAGVPRAKRAETRSVVAGAAFAVTTANDTLLRTIVNLTTLSAPAHSFFPLRCDEEHQVSPGLMRSHVSSI